MKQFRRLTNGPPLPELREEYIDGRRYYVSPSGLRLPSVTTVLSHAKKDTLKSWVDRVGEAEAEKIRNRAGIRGTKFHTMMERYLNGADNIFEDVMPDMKQSFLDCRRALDKIDNIHYQEVALFSETLGVAGRTDVLAEYEGVPSVIDFKTSLKEKRVEWIRNYFEQGAAYSLMYEEMTGVQLHQVVVIIAVDHREEPQVFKVDRNEYIDSLKIKIDQFNKDHSNVC